MNELRKEYQAIVDECRRKQMGFFEDVALECQRLADSKEPVQLTDAEMQDAWHRAGYTTAPLSPAAIAGCRSIEAAVHAKQRAPVTRDVTVFIYLDPDGKPFVCQNAMKGWTLLDGFTRTVELK